jgi:hypothetical protein
MNAGVIPDALQTYLHTYPLDHQFNFRVYILARLSALCGFNFGSRRRHPNSCPTLPLDARIFFQIGGFDQQFPPFSEWVLTQIEWPVTFVQRSHLTSELTFTDPPLLVSFEMIFHCYSILILLALSKMPIITITAFFSLTFLAFHSSTIYSWISFSHCQNSFISQDDIHSSPFLRLIHCLKSMATFL